ncbi:MAG TPA: SRPBCC family protein [Candidatus Limnocylindria bacterium]|jgi:uncharacterized protein YndB with AHSA1/START domain|nr:SRPBCC family protein [Candidatus Limnocylindria bacterium]
MNFSDNLAKYGQIIPDGQRATIVFKRLLAHSPENIWEAITNPGDLKQWLMCSSATIEGRPGGRVEMVAGPAQFHVTGKILIWDPPRVYEHEWNVGSRPEMPEGENAIFRYELTPQEGATLLTVTYQRLTLNTARGFAPGGHVLLDRLEAQLDGMPLPDWMPRFQELLASYPGWQN